MHTFHIYAAQPTSQSVKSAPLENSSPFRQPKHLSAHSSYHVLIIATHFSQAVHNISLTNYKKYRTLQHASSYKQENANTSHLFCIHYTGYPYKQELITNFLSSVTISFLVLLLTIFLALLQFTHPDAHLGHLQTPFY